MTIREAIDLVDKLRPNQYDDELKIMWLNKHDGQFYEEVLKTHSNPPVEIFDGYSKDTSDQTTLIVPDPYSMDVYNYYLQAQIDKENGESDRFNQTIVLYNSAYQAYLNYYHRTHMPLSAGKRFRF